MRLALALFGTLALAPVSLAQDFRDLDVSEDLFAEAADDTARQLANTLGRVADQAGRVAEQARANGNQTRARRFQDLSSRSDTLGREVDRRVVAALTRGDRGRAREQLQSLNQHFQYLDRAYRNIQQVPANIAQNVQRVQTLHRQLERQLQGGGGGGGGFWQCVAVDRGWEEHRGGHRADGQNYQQAQRRALDQCERVHDNCVISSCNQGRG